MLRRFETWAIVEEEKRRTMVIQCGVRKNERRSNVK
jgi:hypothetical protein